MFRGAGGAKAEFGFQRQRAGGKAAVPERDDGVCLTTVTGPWDRKREESAVKRLPTYADRLKSVMTQECTGPRWGFTDMSFLSFSRLILVGIIIIRIFANVI